MDGMERFLAVVIIVCTLAFSALLITGCMVGIYFLFNLLP